MNKKKHLIALDCGNSSYRLVLGTYENNKLSLKVIAQENNNMIKVNGLYYWDLLKMYQFLITNMKKHIAKGGVIDAIGICTWGVDFTLFDEKGYELGSSLSYRNTLGNKVLERLSDNEKKSIFYNTGIYCDRINSVYMMKAIKELMPEKASVTKKLLMIPDIFNYYLTGKMINEPSELSTTQLLDVANKVISKETCDFFDIPVDWFSPIGEHGKIIGNLQDSVKEAIGSDYDIPVVCVPSHDTASAIAAIPTQEDEFLFISTGTWAMIGAELEQPVITDQAIEYGLTNELGALGKTILLKNTTGMFILENMKKEYELLQNEHISWNDFVALAGDNKEQLIIDVNNERFFDPQNMTEEIRKTLAQVSLDKQFTINELLSIVYRSMAANYASTLKSLEEVTGKEFKKVYMVGGGTRNKKIVQLTANISGKEVIACGNESTSLGNLGVQLKFFYPEMALKDIRKIINNSITTESYKH